MAQYYSGWAPYVPVAERIRQGQREVAKLAKAGAKVSPVTIEGRRIATTFWGKAWCDNLESYRDYENRLQRGRSYVRNGSVVDLQIAEQEIRARVAGSSLYTVCIKIAKLADKHWEAICGDCTGGIDSLVELLQGKLSQGVMERLCRQAGGLFPKPSEMTFSCSCPDYASMCKHVAAVLYGVGARLDTQSDLLFFLRAVDQRDLVARLDAAVPLSRIGPEAGRVLEGGDLSALFGLEMGEPPPISSAPPPAGAKAGAKGGAKAAAKASARGAANAKPPAFTEAPVPGRSPVMADATSRTPRRGKLAAKSVVVVRNAPQRKTQLAQKTDWAADWAALAAENAAAAALSAPSKAAVKRIGKVARAATTAMASPKPKAATRK